ncbi:MAG TPA: thiamine-phosphate synthase family protein, partial [Candidatus Thermoplasmatota archaeon]|nr:thiamine-phosphate synthase family protein [Candidatus Thermoplasmatota archaeon]
MKLPDEIVADYFAPTVRVMLAQALERRGLTQNQIADLLGLSQSAVSKYLGGRLQPDPLLLRDPRLTETVDRVSEGLATGRLTQVDALAAFMALAQQFENRGPICALHEREMPALQGLGCTLCVQGRGGAGLHAETEVLANLRQAVRALELAPGLSRLAPRVGSNLAMAVPGAKDASQVAAIPGGFYELRGHVKAPAPPEFGVSRHVAEILLAVQRAIPSRRAALDIASRPEVLAACRRAGLTLLEIEARDEQDPSRIPALIPAGTMPDVL